MKKVKKDNNMDNKKIGLTRVYVVNDQMVVAPNIQLAIAAYQQTYTDSEVREVRQMYHGSACNNESYNALIFIES